MCKHRNRCWIKQSLCGNCKFKDSKEDTDEPED